MMLYLKCADILHSSPVIPLTSRVKSFSVRKFCTFHIPKPSPTTLLTTLAIEVRFPLYLHVPNNTDMVLYRCANCRHDFDRLYRASNAKQDCLPYTRQGWNHERQSSLSGSVRFDCNRREQKSPIRGPISLRREWDSSCHWPHQYRLRVPSWDWLKQ